MTLLLMESRGFLGRVSEFRGQRRAGNGAGARVPLLAWGVNAPPAPDGGHLGFLTMSPRCGADKGRERVGWGAGGRWKAVTHPPSKMEPAF